MRILALLLGLVGLARADNTVPSGGSATLVASLERGPCYGTCPIYKVSVFSDGTLKYEGIRFVKKTGAQTGKLKPGDLDQLVKAFRDARYFDLADAYDHADVTDHASVRTSFSDGGKTKSVHHYLGDHSAPAELAALELAFDQIVKIERFTGKR
jgi:hypothetical protein